jgi:1-acyl-sn-glycerol-3-phosphate acyltransferase
VPKTSSGKIRRAATRDLYLAGTLGRVGGHAARDEAPARRARGRGRAWRAAAAAAGRGLYAAYLGLLVAVIAPMVWIPVALVPSRRLARRLSRAGARALLSLAGCRLTREGGASLAGRPPVLLASNHASYVDVLALLALVPRDFVFAAKAESRRVALPGHAGAAGRPPHRRALRREPERGRRGQARPALEQGQSVLLFPEGTFTAAAGLRAVPPGHLQGRGGDGRARGAALPARDARDPARGTDGAAPGTHPSLDRETPSRPTATAGAPWSRSAIRVAADIAAHCPEPRLDLVAGGPVRE